MSVVSLKIKLVVPLTFYKKNKNNNWQLNQRSVVLKNIFEVTAEKDFGSLMRDTSS